MTNSINRIEKLDEIIEFKIRLGDRIIWGILSALLFFPCLFILILLVPGLFESEGIKLVFNSVVVLACIIGLIDFPLFLNHFFYEITRNVTFNKTLKIIRIKRFGKIREIDLKNNDYKVIRYKPRYNHLEKIPGAEYGKIVIVRNNERFEFSETILENSNLWLVLLSLNSKDKINEVKRQINFIW